MEREIPLDAKIAILKQRHPEYFDHPEIPEGYVFHSNVSDEEYQERLDMDKPKEGNYILGKQAFDSDNQPFEGMRPLFVKVEHFLENNPDALE